MTAHQKPKKFYIDLGVIALVFIALFIFYWVGHVHNQNQKKALVSAEMAFNRSQYSINDPSSIWVIVNKQRPLSPISYVPTNLTSANVSSGTNTKVTAPSLQPIAALAISNMFKAAQTSQINLVLSSGYVSYTTQKGIYNGYLAAQGQKVADSSSIRPGYSEDQTGLAVNLAAQDKTCADQTCFASTSAGKWLAANSYKYGFTLRYPAGKQNITGYSYEPWHFRYVGIGLATELYNNKVTLEQFFNLAPAPNY